MNNINKNAWGKKDKKILLVEDDSASRMVLKEMLRKDGYIDVVETTNGEDAQAKLRGLKFDLIICDWHMPGLSGLQLLENMKTSTDMQNGPLLMVTGETEKQKIVEAIKMGVAGYIVKPLSPKSISSKVAEILYPEK